MMIGFSLHQHLPEPRAPIDYCLSATIHKRGQQDLVLRRPPPELLHGDPGRLLAAFDLLKSKTRVLGLTLSFHESDIDVAAFNRGDPELRRTVASVVELVLAFSRAGIPKSHSLPCIFGTHCHLGRLELNFILPRGAMNSAGQARNYNPRPPTALGRAGWDALRDFLNFSFGWADPLDPRRSQIVAGPQWLESEVAAADHAGQIFGRDRPPQMLLQKLRREFRKNQDAEFIREWRDEILADIDWTVISETPTGCKVGPRNVSGAKNILLRGTVFSNRPAPELKRQIAAREAVMKNSRDRLLHCWSKLAEENRKTLSKGNWPLVDVAAELDSILNSPRLRLPPHHPNFPAPVRADPARRSRWTKVLDTVQSVLRGMLERLEAQLLESRFARLCADLTPRLETLAAALEKKNAERSAENHGRAHRSVGHRSESARDPAPRARGVAPEPSDRRDDASACPGRGRPGGSVGNVARPEPDRRTPGSGRDAREGLDARRRPDPRLADRAHRDNRWARLKNAKHAASEVFPCAPISVRTALNDAGDECVWLHIHDATVSIEAEALHLAAGGLEHEHLSALAERLSLRYEWWRDATRTADQQDGGPSDTPAI